jgi:hypothetical protein
MRVCRARGRPHATPRRVRGHATANSHRLLHHLEGWRNDHTDWQAGDVAAFRALL